MFTVTKCNLAKDQSKPTKAYADAELSGVVLKGIRIIKGENNFFLSMPAQLRTHWDEKQGKYVPTLDDEGKQIYDDHFFPKTKEIRDNMTSAVLAAYEAALANAKLKTV